LRGLRVWRRRRWRRGRSRPTGMRRIGVLMAFDETDPEGKAALSAFTRALSEQQILVNYIGGMVRFKP
jgi:hypothetical protein